MSRELEESLLLPVVSVINGLSSDAVTIARFFVASDIPVALSFP